MTNGVAITNSRRRLLALCDISLQRNDLSLFGVKGTLVAGFAGQTMSSPPSHQSRCEPKLTNFLMYSLHSWRAAYS
jgi:hypothetical protein